MNYTREQLLAFRAEYAVRRRRHRLAMFAFVLCIIGFVILIDTGGSPSYLVSATLFVLTMFDALWNWRCPACRTYLGGAWALNFCPYCGIPLEYAGPPDKVH